jgi:hypothetical protein
LTETKTSWTRKKLTTPRAAAIAGILFALLYGTSMVLVRISIPSDPAADGAWLETYSSTVALALTLSSYAGIAFLWFIGVIRDRLGDLEDRLFATVFLGSVLLFLASTFVGAALAGGLLSSQMVPPSTMGETGVFTFSRAVMCKSSTCTPFAWRACS